jgi:hypothetical protein
MVHNTLLPNAHTFARFNFLPSKLAQPHPDVFIRENLLPMLSSQPNATTHMSNPAPFATSVHLSGGKFNETRIYVNNAAPYFRISGSQDSSIFDCAHSGPAFIIVNTIISIAGVTFRNCVNFNASSGIGGAISARSSLIMVTNCTFSNNMAQTGGAIGVISSNLTVTSSFFENNTASCSKSSTACSAWGGAIGAVETPSAKILNNHFNRNAVNLELIGVRDGSSSVAGGGGGCVSVLYNSDVSDSRISTDGNAFRSCSVRTFGSINLQSGISGVQYGNAYGGAVSVYYGIQAASFLQVRNVLSSFTNNICHNSVINSSVEAVGNVYGGCLSINSGAWSVNESGISSVASVIICNMRMNVSNSQLQDYGVFISTSSLAIGTNTYGGGVSILYVCANTYGGGIS